MFLIHKFSMIYERPVQKVNLTINKTETHIKCIIYIFKLQLLTIFLHNYHLNLGIYYTNRPVSKSLLHKILPPEILGSLSQYLEILHHHQNSETQSRLYGGWSTMYNAHHTLCMIFLLQCLFKKVIQWNTIILTSEARNVLSYWKLSLDFSCCTKTEATFQTELVHIFFLRNVYKNSIPIKLVTLSK